MTDQVKAKAVNMEDMQSFAKVLFNKGIGNRGVCTTAAATAAKEVTLGTTFSLVDGATVLICFTYGISVANATLAVTYGASGSQSTTAAKPIYYRGAALAAGAVKAGDTLMLKYENSSNNRWVVVGTLGSDYPTFGASGANHASGLVPDPGSTQGTTKYLREDGTWQTPPNTTYSTMGASGSSHAGGLVPDTPSTAGTSKYLREDGTWSEPSGGGSSVPANVALLENADNTAFSPNFDAETDTVHVTSQTLTASQKTQARTNIGITISTSEPTANDGNDGDIWIVYEA